MYAIVHICHHVVVHHNRCTSRTSSSTLTGGRSSRQNRWDRSDEEGCSVGDLNRNQTCSLVPRCARLVGFKSPTLRVLLHSLRSFRTMLGRGFEPLSSARKGSRVRRVLSRNECIPLPRNCGFRPLLTGYTRATYLNHQMLVHRPSSIRLNIVVPVSTDQCSKYRAEAVTALRGDIL